MKFDRDTIIHVEKLAHIELTDDERARLTEQLGRIVEYIEQLQAVDTEGVEPTSGVFHEAAPGLREDVVEPSLDHNRVMAMAPDPKNGFFRVPKIIER